MRGPTVVASLCDSSEQPTCRGRNGCGVDLQTSRQQVGAEKGRSPVGAVLPTVTEVTNSKLLLDNSASI